MPATELTQAKLKEMLKYDPDTGVFTWEVTRNNRARAGNALCAIKRDRGIDYRRCMIAGKEYLLHRLAVLYMTGEWPTEVVDHIDGNGLNNRWANLRCVSATSNKRNRKRPSTNKSGIVGVKQKSSGRWMAAIGRHGKSKHLGTFETKRQAVMVRKAWEQVYGFHSNHGRTA